MSQLKNLLLGEMPVARVYEKGKVTYPKPVQDGLVLWYDFLGRKNNDAQKGIAKDLSGNGHDATLYGAAYIKGSGYERGLKFDGVDDFLETQSGVLSTLFDGDFTMEIVAKCDNPKAARPLFSKNGAKSSIWGYTGFGLTNISNPNSLYLSVKSADKPYIISKVDVGSVYANTHFTIVRRGLEILCYVDGKVSREKIVLPSDYGSFSNTSPILIAGQYDANVKSARIYTRALSDTEVAENIAMEKERWSPSYISSQDGLEVWYDFRKSSNTAASKSLVKDLSGNGKNAALLNFAYAKGSGYREDGLVFDGVDDYLSVPAIGVDTANHTLAINEEIYSHSVSGTKLKDLTLAQRNLANHANIASWSAYRRQGFKHILNSAYSSVTDRYTSGFRVHERIFKPLTKYVMSFKIRKRSGNVFNLAGHASWYIMQENTIDGVPGTGWINNYPNDNLTHDISIAFTTASQEKFDTPSADNGLYFQPNRLTTYNAAHELDMWDFKIEEATRTPWCPAPEDTTGIINYGDALRSLQIYNRSLTDAEILHNTKIAQKKFIPVPVQEGMQLWYDFSRKDNLSTTKSAIEDLSQSGADGALRNFAFDRNSGYSDQGLVFDGVDDIIPTGFTLSGTKNYTFQIHLIPKNLKFTQGMNVLMIGSGAGRLWIRAVVASDGSRYLAANTYFGTPETDKAVGNYRINDDVPVVLTVVIDRQSKMEMYINGTSLSTMDISLGKDVPWVTQPLTVGTNYGFYVPPTAVYRSILAYDRVLTAQEIAHNYNIEKEKWKL